MHNIAFVTVVMNDKSIGDFLSGVRKQKQKNFHVFISDYSGNGDFAKFISDSVTVLKRENRGYAYGVNEGLKTAIRQGYDRFCIINDDVYFDGDFVRQIRKSLDTHPGSVTGGKIYYAAGHEYHKDRYNSSERGNVLWYAGGFIDWAHAQAIHRGVDEVDAGQYDEPGRTGFVTGCLMVLDKTVIDAIGFLDESYFLYFEDADYCERAKRAGITLYYDPALVIRHKISQSTGGSGSPLHVRYQRKNLVKFALKYAPLRTKLHVLKNYFFA